MPSSASTAGTTSTAITADTRPTTAPATPTEYRNRCGNRTSEAMATATVNPENRAVRPAVITILWCASRVAPATSISSR